MRKILLVVLLLLPLVLRAETQKVPPDKEAKTLVRDSLVAFNKAVQEKNFAVFYKQELAAGFRDQFPLEKFSAAFQSFIDTKFEISDILKSDPVFDAPPAIDGDGLLVLTGHYPTRPNKVSFKLEYLHEKEGWKLGGINVKATPSVENTAKLPSEKELQALALDSLLAYNKAIQAKNFDSFYQQISKLWRDQTTSEKLKAIFQPAIDKRSDISSIAKVQPTFDGTPAINEDGVLVLKGSYPTQPNKVTFQLKYINEDGAWKLVGITTNL
jgi:hypothetical protein